MDLDHINDHIRVNPKMNIIYTDLKYPANGYFVDIGSGWNLDSNFIWTLEFNVKNDENGNDENTENKNEPAAPLVLIHGLGTGSAIWLMNIDYIIEHSNRQIYAIDMLGFGRSSRPNFDFSDDIEWQMIYALEKWRKAINLERKFILLGHGLGGYLSFSYSFHFPQHVAHLCPLDPWGVPSQQQSIQITSASHYALPYWVNLANDYILQKFSPLRWLKLAGPWGCPLLGAFRSDLRVKYEPILGIQNTDLIVDYVYHCNVQKVGSGELAFQALCSPCGWAKYPIIHRIRELDNRIKITFIFGSRSWIDRQSAFQIKYLLGDERVSINVIQGAGHHVYADRPTEFNELVCCIFEYADKHSRNNSFTDSSSESSLYNFDNTGDCDDEDFSNMT